MCLCVHWHRVLTIRPKLNVQEVHPEVTNVAENICAHAGECVHVGWTDTEVKLNKTFGNMTSTSSVSMSIY